MVLPAIEIIPNEQPKILADASRIQRFQSAVGQLMYLMLATRPDLAYPVGMLAQHASNPSSDHEKALHHLVGYVQHTRDYTLTFYKPTQDARDPGVIQVLSNADWAGETHSGHSTTGMVILKNRSAISWSSKRQGVVSTSTMESEYIALFNMLSSTCGISNTTTGYSTLTLG